MEKSNCLGFYLFILLLLMATAGCDTMNKSSSYPDQETNESLTQGTVMDYRSLDGCEYLILLRSGEKLQPLNLAQEFKVDSLDVEFSYKHVDLPTVCMAGRTIEIIKIRIEQ